MLTLIATPIVIALFQGAPLTTLCAAATLYVVAYLIARDVR